jgi:hypothetical protein
MISLTHQRQSSKEIFKIIFENNVLNLSHAGRLEPSINRLRNIYIFLLHRHILSAYFITFTQQKTHIFHLITKSFIFYSPTGPSNPLLCLHLVASNVKNIFYFIFFRRTSTIIKLSFLNKKPLQCTLSE